MWEVCYNKRSNYNRTGQHWTYRLEHQGNRGSTRLYLGGQRQPLRTGDTWGETWGISRGLPATQMGGKRAQAKSKRHDTMRAFGDPTWSSRGWHRAGIRCCQRGVCWVGVEADVESGAPSWAILVVNTRQWDGSNLGILDWAAITEYHIRGGVNNTCLFLIVLESGKCKIKVSAYMIPAGGPLSGLQSASFCVSSGREKGLCPLFL